MMEHIWKIVLLIVLFAVIPRWLWGQGTKTKIALLKGEGIAPVSSVFWREAIEYCNKNLHVDLAVKPVEITLGSGDIFGYPYVFLAAEDDGPFTFLQSELFQEYLLVGGFLHIHGSEDLSRIFLREIGKIFPEAMYTGFSEDRLDLFSLPPSSRREGNNGQDVGRTWGMMKEGRLLVLFTSDSLNIGSPAVVASVLSYVFREK